MFSSCLALIVFISTVLAAEQKQNSTKTIDWSVLKPDQSYYLSVVTVLQSSSLSVNGTLMEPATLAGDKAAYQSARNSLVLVMQSIYDEAGLLSTLIDVTSVNFNQNSSNYEVTACSLLRMSEKMSLQEIALKVATAVESLNAKAAFKNIFGDGNISINTTRVDVSLFPAIISLLTSPTGISLLAVGCFLLLLVILSIACRGHYSRKHEQTRASLVTNGHSNTSYSMDPDEMPSTVAWN